ncbi:MAG: hypothetical protein M3M94_05355 [Actinomycetota bacterium]|nr:hypothetical protein [Actinomycetota bacterium]
MFPPIRRGGPVLWTLVTLFVFVPVALLVTANITHGRAFQRCADVDPSLQQHRSSNFEVHWTWSPPGFVCLHRNEEGRLIKRTRPEFP